MSPFYRLLSALPLCLSLMFVACSPSGGGEVKAPTEPVKAVQLAAEGQKFDPPVARAAIPAGAWYCDMGTVHYARPEEGDGICPLCKMKLKQKPPASP